MMRIHIRRKECAHDFIPTYSTAELLHGLCHLTHIPKDEIERLTRAEKHRQSREKFEAHKEEIYTLLAQDRGVKGVAVQFKMGYEALQRYLDEEESK